jgi:uncharacterized membrane protein YphA (DoxX/SURF4 family)
MDIALWIVQGILAFAFMGAGANKLAQDYEKLKTALGDWVSDFSPSQIKAIGGVEVLGAIGVILPAVTGILPWLSPLAALGLALTMVGAAWTHLRRGEYPMIAVNVVLLALALFVAYGRFVAEPL